MARSGRKAFGLSIGWQVGEQGCQFFPGTGARSLPRSLVEFVGCDPADPERLAQLGQRPIAVGIGYSKVAGWKAPADSVHETCFFGAELSVTPGVMRGSQ